MNLDIILQNWEKYLLNKIKPVVEKSNDKIEGNIYSEGGKYIPCKSLYHKQKNISELVSNAPKGTEILEIGFNAGYSALLMLMSNPHINLTCVDINSHKYTSNCFQTIKEDYSNINIIYGSSTTILPDLHKQNKTYDIIHIDGGHSRPLVKADVNNSIKLSHSGTHLIIDDTNLPYINNECNTLVESNRATDANVTNGDEYKHRILTLV